MATRAGLEAPVEQRIPARPTIPRLRAAAADCRACPLHLEATQTVFGEGSPDADVVLLGEQPGDAEDRAGRPFVGPAGRLLDEALARAGIDRGDVYITNVVKHFKFMRRGKRRIHKKPNAEEIRACVPWLAAELSVGRPLVVVALGATAAQAMLGRDVRVTKDRGRVLSSGLAERVIPTVHPSSILRAPDDETRRAELDRFVEDLRGVARVLASERALRRRPRAAG